MTSITKRAKRLRQTEEPHALTLTGERQLLVLRTPGQDTLELVDKTGLACLTVVIDETGVTVSARGTKLAFRTDAELTLDAEHLTLRGRRGVAIESRGEICSQGRRQRIIATHGSVCVEANDDVKLDGERILLNS